MPDPHPHPREWITRERLAADVESQGRHWREYRVSLGLKGRETFVRVRRPLDQGLPDPQPGEAFVPTDHDQIEVA